MLFSVKNRYLAANIYMRMKPVRDLKFFIVALVAGFQVFLCVPGFLFPAFARPFVSGVHDWLDHVKFVPVVHVFTKSRAKQWSKDCVLIEARTGGGAWSEIYARYPGCVPPFVKFFESPLHLALTRYFHPDRDMPAKIESVGRHYCAADPARTEISITRFMTIYPVVNEAPIRNRHLLGIYKCSGGG